MAVAKHIEIALAGRSAIKSWRNCDPYVPLDLSNADLGGADLYGADMPSANCSGANLRGVNLADAYLAGAQLSNADLSYANLRYADLSEASLRGAKLAHTIFYNSSLRHADLREAELWGTLFSNSGISGSDFTKSTAYDCRFDFADLRGVKGLDAMIHTGPSRISTDILIRSKGSIPDSFLKGCGLQDWEIFQAKMYDPALSASEIAELQIRIFEKRTHGPMFIGGVFISYSQFNQRFVDGIYQRLKKEGVPVWLDRHDLIAGNLQKQISKAIRLNDVVLLVLSEAAIKSDWVESELEIARKREQVENRDVLCPISIDDAWKSKLDDDASDRALWRTLTKKAIIDFSPAADLEVSFAKLLRGLKVNYPK